MSKFIYEPVGMDAWDRPHGLEPGAVLAKLPPPRGCPNPRGMGHVYVGCGRTGRFIGLVLLNSLRPATKAELDAAAA